MDFVSPMFSADSLSVISEDETEMASGQTMRTLSPRAWLNKRYHFAKNSRNLQRSRFILLPENREDKVNVLLISTF